MSCLASCIVFLVICVVLVFVFYFFFFFKQKTAYEMRISDWSSDVCSSDLTPGKHDYALGRTGTPPPTPSLAVPDLSDVAAPDATDWTLTGESVASDGGSLPVIAFSGSVANPNASAVVFEYRASGNTEWISAGTEEPETTRKIVATVAPGIEYEGAVSYRVRGVGGARLILGPVTSGHLDGGGNHNWLDRKSVV